MQYKYRIFSILFIPILALAIAGGCGGGGSSDDGGGNISNEMIVVEGTIADVVANAGSTDNSFFLARIFNYIKPTLNAVAQEEMDDFSGITVVALDSNGVEVGSAVSDENGNFEIEVPCDTPISLLFTLDGSSIEIGGLNFPCPTVEETTVFITVTLDFTENGNEDDDSDSDIEIEEEDMPDTASISCQGQEELELSIDELIVEGEGGPCIISAGGCEISIEAGLVSLTGCSTCIDTRGNSSVEIKSEKFECIADDTGIRSVGSSSVEVEVEITAMMDGTGMSSNAITQTAEEADLFISAGITGVDARGNSKVELEADVDDDSDMMDMMDDTMMSTQTASIAILGGENSIKAVGNSEVEVEADECIIDPADPEVKGNAEVEIDCDDEDSDSDELNPEESDSDI